jgi:hypothetical protein
MYYSSGYYPTYYSSAYYPTSYYSTAYYPTSYYSTTYYPSYYSSAYYPTYYYSSAYYPTYYSTAYYPTYYSSAYYPTYYSSAYYPTAYYPSAYYYPTYYSSSYYYPTTYYPSSYYYYPTTYYARGYYLGANTKREVTSQPATKIATDRRKVDDSERLAERQMLASKAASDGDIVTSEAPTAAKSPLLRRTTYQAVSGSARDVTQSPPVVSKTPPSTESGKRAASGAGAGQRASKPGVAAPAEKAAPAQAPQGEVNEPTLEPAPPLDSTPKKRDSLRPRYQSQATRNVLLGRVESDAGEAREGVRVTVSSRNDPGLARAGVSNAFGRFAIRLDEGDWTVRVTMPSGRIYAVRQISVQNGHVVDGDEGRDIPNLIISY